VFENKVLRRIFGPKRDEVTGEWRKMHNKELHDLYSSPSIIRIIKSIHLKPSKPPNEPMSYRPISLLPILSKVYKKLFLHRLFQLLKTAGY
jgi:hypothetical protein